MYYSRLVIADRIFAWFSVVLTIISWSLAIWAWPDLPARIPTHFGAAGWPDAFGQKTFWTVFLIPLLQVVLNTILLWAYRHPQYSNIPSTMAIMALPEPIRSMMYRLIRRMIAIMSVAVNLLLAQIVLAIVSVGFGVTDHFNPLILWGLVILLLVIVIRSTTMAYQLVKRARNEPINPSPTPKLPSA